MRLDVRGMSLDQLKASKHRISMLISDTERQLTNMRGIRNRHEDFEVWGPTRSNVHRLMEKKQHLEATLMRVQVRIVRIQRLNHEAFLRRQKRRDSMELAKCPSNNNKEPNAPGSSSSTNRCAAIPKAAI